MTSARIDARFKQVADAGRTALVSYLMGGDPDLETSFEMLCALRDNGADIIELGAPFTDPMADGPSIQEAALRALANNVTLKDVLDLARRFRLEDDTTPLVLMGYANPIHHMGYANFAVEAAQAGIDGAIVVDLPPEEDGGLRAAFKTHGLSVIRLATPTTNEARMSVIADGASGFIYYVAVAGVTGAGAAVPEDIKPGVDMARNVSGLPVCVGFGIRSGAQAVAMAEIADGVVVGSAFVDYAKQADMHNDRQLVVNNVGKLAGDLRAALDGDSV